MKKDHEKDDKKEKNVDPHEYLLSHVTVKEVTVSRGFTLPIGQFTMTRAEVGLKADVPSGLDHNAVYDFLTKETRALLDEERRQAIKERE